MTYRVGIIGCGGMGRSHARSWSQRDDAEVAAAMDISQGSARGLAEEYSVPATYTDYDEMLEKENLDIVSIPTWQGVRAAATIACAEAGIMAILGEKTHRRQSRQRRRHDRRLRRARRQTRHRPQ